ncbi:hypothetical protein ABIB57_002588 [Devosia sp. UYZn731]|uniref:GFA family protein n=1 Tax=Devosia sp. UYZn731 TaxID=3156345 RepID=UPI0033977C55
MDLPEFPVEGGCQCGAVRYRLTGAPLGVYNCHCKDCQRFSGAGWAMSMPVARERVELISGTLNAYDSVADSGRVVRMLSCSRCNTRVWNEPLSAPAMLVLRPGTLDDISWVVSVGNIWTESAAPWAPIDPRQVHFPGQPPDRQPLYDAWAALTQKEA